MTDLVSKCWLGYKHAVSQVERVVNKGLGRLGEFVARRPASVICITSLVSIAFIMVLPFRLADTVENRGDKLWIPQDSRWITYADDAGAAFDNPGADSGAGLIFAPADGQDNVLTVPAIRQMFEARGVVNQVTTLFNGSRLQLQDVCWEAIAGGCRESGILSFFNGSRRTFEDIADQGQSAVLRALNAQTLPDGSAAVPALAFADVTRDTDGQITAARLARWGTQLSPEVSSAGLRELPNAWTEAAEAALLPDGSDTVQPDRFSDISVLFEGPSSLDMALEESVTGDIALVGAAIVFICIAALAALFVPHRIFARTSLAACGVLSVCLSIGASFGIAASIGIPFTQLTQILPFILLGIGVDDMFVLVRSLEEVDAASPGLPPPARCRATLSSGGMSITVTSLTNAAAFLFGSATAIPAVRWFCWYAAIGIAMDWLLQVTFFMACFVLTERRIAAGRYDWLCCFPRRRSKASNAEPESSTSSSIRPAASSDAGAENSTPAGPAASSTKAVQQAAPSEQTTADQEAATAPAVAPAARPAGLLSVSPDSGLQWVLNKVYVPALLHPAGKAFVLLLLVAAIVCGGVGITRVGEGLKLSTLAPDGHYSSVYSNALDIFAKEGGYPSNIYFQNLDQSDEQFQRKMLRAWKATLDAEDTFNRADSPSSVWLTAFHDYVADEQPAAANEDGTVAQQLFSSLLQRFLQDQPTWRDDIAFGSGNDAQRIIMSTFPVMHITDQTDGTYEREMVSGTIDVIDSINADIFAAENEDAGSEVFFISASFYSYWETNRIIVRELVLNLLMALLGIAIISTIFLIHPLAVLLIVIAVGIVDLILFAEMWLVDIPINTVSVVNLVMAVGLAVDYSLHIVHTFLSLPGESRAERARGTVRGVAAAVAVAAFTTFLGVVILAGASSEIMRTFFQLLFGTVVGGSIVGLAGMPVLLSLVGPAACLTHGDTAAPPKDATKDGSSAATEPAAVDTSVRTEQAAVAAV